MKKTIFIIISMIGLIFAGTAYANEITVNVNDERVIFEDVKPIILEGRTLVPIRKVFEKLGYTVIWKGETQTILIKNDTQSMEITLGKKDILYNGAISSKQLDVTADVINGRTLLPLRIPAEILGYNVAYNGQENRIDIKPNEVLSKSEQLKSEQLKSEVSPTPSKKISLKVESYGWDSFNFNYDGNLQEGYNFSTLAGYYNNKECAKININSNEKWSISSNQNWIKFYTYESKEGASLDGTANKKYDVLICVDPWTKDYTKERNATVTISSGNVKKTIKINQYQPRINGVFASEYKDYLKKNDLLKYINEQDLKYFLGEETNGIKRKMFFDSYNSVYYAVLTKWSSGGSINCDYIFYNLANQKDGNLYEAKIEVIAENGLEIKRDGNTAMIKILDTKTTVKQEVSCYDFDAKYWRLGNFIAGVGAKGLMTSLTVSPVVGNISGLIVTTVGDKIIDKTVDDSGKVKKLSSVEFTLEDGTSLRNNSYMCIKNDTKSKVQFNFIISSYFDGVNESIKYSKEL